MFERPPEKGDAAAVGAAPGADPNGVGMTPAGCPKGLGDGAVAAFDPKAGIAVVVDPNGLGLDFG